MAESSAAQAPPQDPAAPQAQASAPLHPTSVIEASSELLDRTKPEDPVGSTFAGRYRILAKLGEGGMGQVYLAEHVIIEKRVALKVLSRDFARRPELVERFMQEAKAASRIGHENIVDITDFGETPSGSVFFAMEYLDGMDLAQHIRDGGPMPFERVCRITLQICRALGAAHRKGIIHRDLKPENVFLIEREGRGDFVKILDFGIAKMNTLDGEAPSRLTRTGVIFGTPEYMAPEQARGDKPDHRVDIYALGCIVYEMLTGDVPFHADTFMGVLTRHMFDQPEPLAHRNADIMLPLGGEEVVMRALVKDRNQRYQTMKEFSLALATCAGGISAAEAWDEDLPGGVSSPSLRLRPLTGVNSLIVTELTAATPAPQATNANRVVEQPRSPRWISGAVIGLVTLLLVVVVYWGLLRRPTPEPARPVAPVSTTPSVPAKPAQVKIKFVTIPAGAQVWLGTTFHGQTPIEVGQATGSEPLAFILRKNGYQEYTERVIPDRDQAFTLTLIAEVAPVPVQNLPPVAAPPVRSPLPQRTRPASKRGGKKPNTKLELKDPF